MRILRLFLLVVCALALASNALAQTKISGTLNCNKAELSYAIPIPGLEGYAFSMNQNKCTWSRGFWIQGLQPTEFINTPFIDIEGASGQITAKGVNRYDNGDKTYSRSTGISDLKASTSSGKWTYTGGTGRLSGIKGGGTYTCKMESAEVGAGYTCEVVGEYTLPAAKK